MSGLCVMNFYCSARKKESHELEAEKWHTASRSAAPT